MKIDLECIRWRTPDDIKCARSDLPFQLSFSSVLDFGPMSQVLMHLQTPEHLFQTLISMFNPGTLVKNGAVSLSSATQMNKSFHSRFPDPQTYAFEGQYAVSPTSHRRGFI